MNLSAGAFSGKRVLVTGHTGFKGSWLCAWLCSQGAEVYGLALPPDPGAPLFERLGLEYKMHHTLGDIRDLQAVRQVFAAARPEIVFHLAAQALVLRSYSDPVETFSTNVLGSVHVLEACRECDETRALVYVTTDKCYMNREWVWGYRENDSLGGRDPYSASKACAEIVFQSYVDSFLARDGRLAAASARAGNVIGGGDWSENRIVPDCIRALERGEAIVVRNPAATRPWQHVLEPLGAYLLLGANLLDGNGSAVGSWNIGPDLDANRSVGILVDEVIRAWGSGSFTCEARSDAPHEASLLHLNCDKIRQGLGWRPVWGFEESVGRTVGWYRDVNGGADPWDVTTSQIAAYTSALMQQGEAR